MTSLHELYLAVKEEVEAAVTAVNSALTSAASIAEQAIQDALAAVNALDDYIDYFGMVGTPIDQLVEELLEGLYALALQLDQRGYYAMYQKTFGAANQYQTAKNSYDGFTGGLGGETGGAGTSGSWNDDYPWLSCFNRNGATINALSANTPPPAEKMNFSVILGPCSEVFAYEEVSDYWGQGLYQYARLHAWIKFYDLDVIFAGDYGEYPAQTEPSLSYYQIITDRTATMDIKHSQARENWLPSGPIATWPYDSHWEAILTEEEEQYRDRQMTVIGQYEYGGHNYWLYNHSYWMAIQQPGFYDGSGQPVASSYPEQLVWINPCTETPEGGKDIFPKPLIWPIIRALPLPMLQQFATSLRLGVDFRPYELCFEGQKLLWEGEQLTFGEV